MKIIEALKQLKYLSKKADDLQLKLQQNCADMEFDTPLFPDMKAKVDEWLQGHTDVVREIGRLRYRLQKTNVMTPITIKLHDVDVTKSLYEWIQRRKDLANMELKAWQKLSDRNLKDSQFMQTNGVPSQIKMRRYYDPAKKEKQTSMLSLEPTLIDAALEIANCSHELLE
jgi:hypothetical protein